MRKKKIIFCAAGTFFGIFLILIFGGMMTGMGSPLTVSVYLTLLFPANVIVIILSNIFEIPLGETGLLIIPIALSVPIFYGWLGLRIGGKL